MRLTLLVYTGVLKSTVKPDPYADWGWPSSVCNNQPYRAPSLATSGKHHYLHRTADTQLANLLQDLFYPRVQVPFCILITRVCVEVLLHLGHT